MSKPNTHAPARARARNREEAARVQAIKVPSMKYFFEDIDHVAALLEEAESWVGTPFMAYGKAKGPGGGVDCARICEAVMINCGVVEPFEFPMTPMDYTMHNDRSLVLEYLRGQIKTGSPPRTDPQSKRLARHFEEVKGFRVQGSESETRNLNPEPFPNPEPFLILPGDLLAFRVGRAVNHLTVALDAIHFLHCLKPVGTVIANLQDSTFAPRLQTVFRARAKPLKTRARVNA